MSSVPLGSVEWAASEFSRLNAGQVDALNETLSAARDIMHWERGSVRVNVEESVIFVLGERAALILDWNDDLALVDPKAASVELGRCAGKLKLDMQQWSMDDILAKGGVSVTLEDRDGDIPIDLEIGHRLMLAGLLDDVAKAGFDYGTWINASITIEPRVFVHGVITISKRNGVIFTPAV